MAFGVVTQLAAFHAALSIAHSGASCYDAINNRREGDGVRQCVLSVRNLCISSETETLLENISFDLFKGESLGIVGLNGVGKTLLAKMLCGWLRPDSGTVTLDGRRVVAREAREETFAGIGYVSETPNVLPNLSVAENLFIGENAMRGVFMRRRRMVRMAETVFGEYHFRLDPRASAATLTCAQRTMLMVARQLLRIPKALIIDDLAGTFSENELENLDQVVEEYLSRGGTLIYTTHNYADVMRRASRILVLRDSALVAEFESRDLDKRLLRKILYDVDALMPAMAASATRDGDSREELLSLENVSAGHVRELSLCLHRGEILGLAGVVGSGKSDLLQCLSGLRPAESGTIRFQGRRVEINSPRDAIRLGIAACPDSREDILLSPNDSIRVNVTLRVLKRISVGPFLSRRRERLLADEHCRQLSLGGNVHRKLRELNNASLLKLALAQCIASNPQVLLLDEPNREMDRNGIRELCGILENQRAHCGMLLAFSKLDEMTDLCDHVLVMNGGRCVAVTEKGVLTYDNMMSIIMGVTQND